MSKKNTRQYDVNFLRENMMGPSAMLIIEEMAQYLNLKPGMKVLDLGCGKGLTSIFLAEEFDITVFATDLWIEPTENHERFKSLNLEDRIIPIHAEAHALPYARNFFDSAISVDSYHYYGIEEDYLQKHLSPLVKPGGLITVVVPGLKEEFADGIPDELKPHLPDNHNFHSCQWWQELWEKDQSVRITDCRELSCMKESWDEWLMCDNEYARHDIDMMKAEAGRYFNLVSIQAVRL